MLRIFRQVRQRLADGVFHEGRFMPNYKQVERLVQRVRTDDGYQSHYEKHQHTLTEQQQADLVFWQRRIAALSHQARHLAAKDINRFGWLDAKGRAAAYHTMLTAVDVDNPYRQRREMQRQTPLPILYAPYLNAIGKGFEGMHMGENSKRFNRIADNFAERDRRLREIRDEEGTLLETNKYSLKALQDITGPGLARLEAR